MHRFAEFVESALSKWNLPAKTIAACFLTFCKNIIKDTCDLWKIIDLEELLHAGSCCFNHRLLLSMIKKDYMTDLGVNEEALDLGD